MEELWSECRYLDGLSKALAGQHRSTFTVWRSIGFNCVCWLVRILICSLFTHAGVMGLLWYGVWLWLAFEKPSKHPTITAQEIHYIEKSIGPVSMVPPNLKTTPWVDIFHSKPVYAIIVANFCRSWTFYLLIISQPTYFKEVFKFSTAVVSNSFFLIVRNDSSVSCGKKSY